MTKQTAGKFSVDLLKSSYQNDHSAHEQMGEQLKDYESNINQAVAGGKAIHPGDFYVVVLMKKERLLSNIIRLYYLSRKTCPTPQHEQVVYKYHHVSGELEFIWVVPSLEACVTLYNERHLAHPEERQLVNFVLDYQNGTLLRRMKELDGETVDTKLKEYNGTNTQSGLLITN